MHSNKEISILLSQINLHTDNNLEKKFRSHHDPKGLKLKAGMAP